MSVIDISLEDNKLTQAIMDCLFKVHYTMGPGLLESVYEECLVFELGNHGLSFERQVMSYLRLGNLPLGFLVNFNVPLIKDGVRRFVNKHQSSASPRLCGDASI